MPKIERNGQLPFPENFVRKPVSTPVVEKGLPNPNGSYDKDPKSVSKEKDAPKIDLNQPSVGFNKPWES